MVINTKFEIGDEVFFYEDGKIQSGILDAIELEITRFGTSWIYEFRDGYKIQNYPLYESEEEAKLKLGLP